MNPSKSCPVETKRSSCTKIYPCCWVLWLSFAWQEIHSAQFFSALLVVFLFAMLKDKMLAMNLPCLPFCSMGNGFYLKTLGVCKLRIVELSCQLWPVPLCTVLMRNITFSFKPLYFGHFLMPVETYSSSWHGSLSLWHTGDVCEVGTGACIPFSVFAVINNKHAVDLLNGEQVLKICITIQDLFGRVGGNSEQHWHHLPKSRRNE